MRVGLAPRPVARLNGELLLLDRVRKDNTLLIAQAERDDEQDTVGRLDLLERLHRVRTEQTDNVDVAVCHRDRTEVLLRALAAAHSKLADRAEVRRLRLLAAHVRVHLRVEDDGVDVVAKTRTWSTPW